MSSATTGDSAGSVAARIGDWVERLLPDPARAAALAAALREWAGGHGAEPIDAEGCRRIEQVCHRYSRHLTLTFDPAGSLAPDVDAPAGWPPPDGAAIVRAGGGVTSVAREGRVAVVRVDSLEAWEFAEPFVTAAVALTRGCDGLVLDLRANGGGAMDTLAQLAGFVLGEAGVLLATVTTHDETREWRTPPVASRGWGGRAAVLVSERTYSSGEALAYVLQNRGIPVIGERTPGAADHCAPTRVSRFVEALIPYAVVRDPLTGGNWEGRGVVPDAADLASSGYGLAMPSSKA